jgi:hypothetical protein
MTRPTRFFLRGLLILAACTLPAVTALAQDGLPTAREVVDRFVETVGGDKLSERSSMSSTGTFAIPAQGLEGPLTMHAKAPDHLLVEIEIPGYGKVRTGYNDSVGWSIDPATGAQVLTDQPLAQLADQANFFSLLYRDEDHESLTMIGEADFHGTACYQIEVVGKGGLSAQHFFSQESGLLVGMEADQYTPMGAIPTSTQIKDYQDFDGIMIATRSEQTMMGMQQVMTVTSVSFEPIDDAVFALPPEIEALAEKAAEAGKN